MAAASKPDNAGVNFPPPLIYVAGVVIGWLLHRWRPMFITAGPSNGRSIGAALAFIAFLAFFGGAFSAFWRAHTTLIPNQPATAFVTNGPYRITRNPMYVSLVALYLAVTLVLNSWWPVALLPLVIVALDRAVIAREERYLAKAFPEAYGAYCARVRRWL
ncbi:MAG: isoprenylcysteine carboxylmethyltransferase family protein [bacterium]